MSAQQIRILVGGALLLHSLAHAIALLGALAQANSGAISSLVTLRSWLLPDLKEEDSGALALPFWGLATLGFLTASLPFFRLVSGDFAWRQLALAASAVSTLGIVIFAGRWPGSPNRGRSYLNSLVALTMNAAILATQLVLGWPSSEILGG